MEQQAMVWYMEGRFEDAKSEGLRAADVYEKLGVTRGVEDCRNILQAIEEAMNERGLVASGKDSDGTGELLETVPPPPPPPPPLISCSQLSQPSSDSASDDLVPPSSRHTLLTPFRITPSPFPDCSFPHHATVPYLLSFQ